MIYKLLSGVYNAMNKPTKKQHYIWRNYLAAWTKGNTSDGQIVCLRGDIIFPVSLRKIAQENCFYGVKKMTKEERTLVHALTIKGKTGTHKNLNEKWVDIYCAPFDLKDELIACETLPIQDPDHVRTDVDQYFDNWLIEHVEKIHAQIEETGIPYISSLRQDNLDFWSDTVSRDKFSFFLCHQYFRTKKIRDAIIAMFEKGKQETGYFTDIHPENMWIPLTLVYASNVGMNIAQTCSAVLLKTKDSNFVVGDQPVINTYSTFEMSKEPDDVEFFYPITPKSALLLTKNPQYTSGEIIFISSADVKAYNHLEYRSAREMIFAKERSHLNGFVHSKDSVDTT